MYNWGIDSHNDGYKADFGALYSRIHIAGNTGVILQCCKKEDKASNHGVFGEVMKAILKKIFGLPTDSDELNSKGIEESKMGRYESALSYFEEALKLDPRPVYALNNRGNALSYLAKMKEGGGAENLFEQSFGKLKKAEEIKEGFAAYNIACVYSLMGEVSEALIWLEKSLKMKFAPSKTHILADSDLYNIKDMGDFKKLMSVYLPE